MRYGFGIDLGGTTVKLAFFEESGVCLDKWEIPTVKDGNGEQILPDIAAAILAHLEKKQISKESVLGIGIGVPGAVDGDGIVFSCINLGWGWAHSPDFPLPVVTMPLWPPWVSAGKAQARRIWSL